jgi:hypothetical protein
VADLAPIVLFIYNRPRHTEQTLAALAASPLAIESDLIIYADGPKRPEHADSVQETRAIARNAVGFRSVSFVERNENFGLARSIISGVTETCNTYGRAIVLEDDLVVAPGFLAYMNRALDRYANEENVMQISGYMYPISHPEELPETFFSTLPTSWGWAIWHRAWSSFDPDAKDLDKRIGHSRMREFNRNDTFEYQRMLSEQASGAIDVWGVRWYATMFLKEGLCLHPANSLVRNIGMDGTGVNCGASDAYDVGLGDTPERFPIAIKPLPAAEAKIEDFFRSLKGSWARRSAISLKKFILDAIYK